MISVTELKRWLETLENDDSVYVDEGGLTLCSEGDPEAYLEVGGERDDDSDDDFGDGL